MSALMPSAGHNEPPPDDDLAAMMQKTRANVGAALEARRLASDQLFDALAGIARLALSIRDDPKNRALFAADAYFAKTGRWSNDPYLAAAKFSKPALTTNDVKTASTWARAIKYCILFEKVDPEHLADVLRAVEGVRKAADLFSRGIDDWAAGETADLTPTRPRAAKRDKKSDADEFAIQVTVEQRVLLEAAELEPREQGWLLLVTTSGGMTRLARVTPSEIPSPDRLQL